MTDNLTISKVRPEKISSDFRALRQIGIQQLEKLGTNIWTDFNLHDPGITMLEVLCYAITDLSYRTNFSISDLLAAPSGSNQPQKKSFFSASEILTNCPTTELDLRKLLIDLHLKEEDQSTKNKKAVHAPKNVQGGFRPVKNAWLFKGAERACKTYMRTQYNFTPEDVQKIKTQYPVYSLLTLETMVNYDKDTFRQNLSAIRPEFIEFTDQHIETFRNFTQQEDGTFAINKASFDLFKKEYSAFSIFNFNGAPFSSESFDQVINIFKNSITAALTEQQICFLIKAATKNEVYIPLEGYDYANEDENFVLNGLYDIFLELDESIDPDDQVSVNRIIEAERDNLLANRNLCEDFLHIAVVDTKEFGINAEIVVSSDANIDQIQAEMLYQIQAFLTPRINFHMLEELLKDPSLSCEDIFNGPMLHHGFIKNSDLFAAKLREEVYTSDLYQIVMDVPGVESIKCLEIGFCEEDSMVISPQPCLMINPAAGVLMADPKSSGVERPVKYKPILSQECSSIFFTIGNTRTIADQGEVNAKLALFNEIRKKPDVCVESEIKVAPGRYRNLNNYISIQDEFPHTYHVGPEGISDTASDKRKAQVKQLKGYLLFFDQLLANYLAQLGEVRNLLTVEQDPSQSTAFYHSLYKVAGVKDLLVGFTGEDEADWEAFTKDKDNDYIKGLQEIIETESEQQNRKNAFLDHLLARFGEQFTDYALSLYPSNSSDHSATANSHSIEKVLSEKANFLKQVPALSKTRGKAFNYHGKDCGKPDIWDSDNVAGLKKRASRLLGFQEMDRKTLSCQPNFKIKTQRLTKGRSKYYQLLVWQTKGEAIMEAEQPLLEGTKEYEKKRNADRDSKAMFNALFNEENQLVRLDPQAEKKLRAAQPQPNPEDHIFRLYLKDEDGEFVARSPLLSQVRAEKLKEGIQSLAFPEHCSKEGFHIVEHLLLRPLKKDYETLQPFHITPFCLSEDPYSFWLSVIVPNWMKRFKDENAQSIFEQTLRKETPAHIGVRFLWINHEQMYEFETTYLRWLKSINEQENEKEIKTHTNALTTLLNQLDQLNQ